MPYFSQSWLYDPILRAKRILLLQTQKKEEFALTQTQEQMYLFQENVTFFSMTFCRVQKHLDIFFHSKYSCQRVSHCIF